MMLHWLSALRQSANHDALLRPDGLAPSFARPVSQLVSGDQIRDPAFEQWRIRFRMRSGLNRKLWEYLYIARVMEMHLDFGKGPNILGFGVGRERIPAVLASRGCRVLATDWADGQDNGDWSSRSLDDLLHPLEADWDPALRNQPLCDSSVFARHVTFRPVDMRAIPEDLREFDALWSCGSLEHLGGLAQGVAFIERSMACLKPGGIAVHTTEYNLSSDEQTLDEPNLCLFRRRDIEALAQRLRRSGHEISLNLWRPSTPENLDVDRPPYHYEFSMNAQLGLFVITSVGLIIRKARKGR